MRAGRFLLQDQLQTLLDRLCEAGYRVIGPQVRDGAIQYLDLRTASELPSGWRDSQSPGRYRLRASASPRRFAWANGPQAFKPQLFRSKETLWRCTRDGDGRLTFDAEAPATQPLAVIGARACDIAALGLQDAHFLDRTRDPAYTARRRDLFIVAVHCMHPADTCFCASTGDGPRVTGGFDLALSELDDGFVVEVGSDAGRAVAEGLPLIDAGAAQLDQADAEIAAAGEGQSRQLPQAIAGTLSARPHHSRWDEVATRCLACGNCTSVCPTCFCSAERDVPMLDGMYSEHVREWDSCFSEGHAHLHGYQVRPTTTFRYRQWLTHKLDTWHAQYGRSGCVGCGRCITWCPVGIDLTEEAASLCAADADAGDAS